MLKMERNFLYLRIRVTGGEVRRATIRKKNPGELLGPLAGAYITIAREDRYEAPWEGAITAAIRTAHGGRPPRPERVKGPMMARITFDGGQSREWQILGSRHVEAVVEAAEFNELAALEPPEAGPAVPGVPYPRRRGRLGGLIAGVLSAPCPQCAAPPGCGCDPASPVVAEMIQMATSPRLTVHTRRTADAITAGAVSRRAIVAQFKGNPLPVDVAKAVVAARRRAASRLSRLARADIHRSRPSLDRTDPQITRAEPPLRMFPADRGSGPVPCRNGRSAAADPAGATLRPGYLRLVQEQLARYLAVLGLAGGGDARLAAGQFHDVVLAGDVAYRFPRDEESRRRLPAAVALLAVLSEAGLPAAVPVPLSAGHLDSPLGECHVPLTRLPGRPLGQVSGDRAEEAVITDLAMLLDRLAELGSSPAIAALVPPAGPDHWPRFASRVRHVLYPLMSARGRQRADAELAAVTATTAAGGALVHTDLGGANLLWTTAAGVPRLAGILDWDHARIGGQASDLASIAATIGWPLARRIDGRRHRGTSRMLADAKAIAGTFALQQALPAALNGDQASLDEGLRQYR